MDFDRFSTCFRTHLSWFDLIIYESGRFKAMFQFHHQAVTSTIKINPFLNFPVYGLSNRFLYKNRQSTIFLSFNIIYSIIYFMILHFFRVMRFYFKFHRILAFWLREANQCKLNPTFIENHNWNFSLTRFSSFALNQPISFSVFLQFS